MRAHNATPRKQIFCAECSGRGDFNMKKAQPSKPNTEQGVETQAKKNKSEKSTYLQQSISFAKFQKRTDA